MKKFVQALPMLTATRAGETLIMYIAASKESINATLFAKRSEGKIPVYFVSRVLQGAELNYPALEKLILALVHAARRLRIYFQVHMIMVLTSTPIRQALTGPEKTRRVAKWAIELGEHDIVFLKIDERETPVDFLPEIPLYESGKGVKEKEVSDPSNKWKLYIDRAFSFNGAGAGLMLIDPAGKEYTYTLCFEFETTNNEAVRGTPSRISYSLGNGNHKSSDIPRLATSGKPNKDNLHSEIDVNQKLLAEGKDRTKGVRRVHN
uniref:Putative ribonuclease H-like domain-containing protein n=1 Tax=Tanacetum cinerariifolium TaxID=118510 RepID=A0A6L2K4R8_TANCI|nr:putative ribonuclease H-like domain-containing protein [Tanacetum cinerariifolium]